MRGEYSWTVGEAQDAMYTAAGIWDRGYQRVIVRAASSAGASGGQGGPSGPLALAIPTHFTLKLREI
jgi:hypothetical protein